MVAVLALQGVLGEVGEVDAVPGGDFGHPAAHESAGGEEVHGGLVMGGIQQPAVDEMPLFGLPRPLPVGPADAVRGGLIQDDPLLTLVILAYREPAQIGSPMSCCSQSASWSESGSTGGGGFHRPSRGAGGKVA
ncbi:hypothetical protein GCM10010232_38120 [Streptomyces amakusaensis]